MIINKYYDICIKHAIMKKTRLFIDEEDYRFIMENKRDSGVSMQAFISQAIKYQIAVIKKEIAIEKLKSK